MNDSPENQSEDDPPYQVGYGRPPKSTQFKPGQSGNPRGRAAMSGNVWNEARSAFAEPMRVKERPQKQSRRRKRTCGKKSVTPFAETGRRSIGSCDGSKRLRA
jgi:hypothetical protein